VLKWLKVRIGVDLIKICRALNCENKLRIIDLIFRKGRKSITDVRNELDLSFSTTHKYLKQLEDAEILFSENVAEDNRDKKIYSLNGFLLNLSPARISQAASHITKREDKLKYYRMDILGR